MGILSKNTVIFLPKFRYVCRRNNSSSSMNLNPSLYIPKRHLNNDNNKPNKQQQQQLLLKRFFGNTVNEDTDYFSTLSTDQTFSPQDNFYLPFAGKNHDWYPDTYCYCNGLSCCYDENGKVVLWNPSTNEFKLLPKSPLQGGTCPIYVECGGFGFDPNSADYKFVRFSIPCPENEDESHSLTVHVELYSLKTDSWKELLYPQVCTFGPSVYINGFCYWLGEDDSIFSFNFPNEKFSLVTVHPKIGRPLEGGAKYDCQLVEFDGSLGCISYPGMGINKTFELWVMKEGGSWTSEFIVQVANAEKPLGFYGKDKLFFESIYRELMLFDCATGELKGLGITDYPQKMEIFPFVKSLVPLNGISQLEELAGIVNNKEAEMAIGQAKPTNTRSE